MDKTLVSILGGLGGMFGWGISDYFANLSSGKIGHSRTFFWSQVAGMLFALLLIPFFGLDLGISPVYMALIAVAAVFYATAYLFFYKAFEIGNVSIVSATINLYAVFTMIFAFIFLGQTLTNLQLFGVSMIIGGVILVSVNFKDLKNKRIKLLSGVKQTLIAAVLFGVFWNISEVLSEEIGWLSTTLFVKVGAIAFLLMFAYVVKQNLSVIKVDRKVKYVVALVGVLEAAAVACVNFGIIVGDVILVTPISSALSVVTILMAVIFLKEKISMTQALGMGAAVTGIMMTGF